MTPDDPRVRRDHRGEWERFEAEWRRRYLAFWLSWASVLAVAFVVWLLLVWIGGAR